MIGVQAATIAAWAAVATVVIYVGLFLYARRQVAEARQLREEQTRPFIVVEFVPDFLITFRVRNIGATLARNVKVTWDQWPAVSRSFAAYNLWKSPQGSVLFDTGIPCLSPGQEIATHFDHFPNRVKEGLPMTYRVTVDYDNFALTGKERRHYQLAYVLDLDLYKDLRASRRRGMHELVQEVQGIKDLMDRWTDTGTRGLRVASYDRDRYVARENRPMHIDRIRQVYRSDRLRGVWTYFICEFRRQHGLHGWGEM